MLTVAQALANTRSNTLRRWHSGPDTGTRGTDPADASNRIFDGYADIRPTYDGPRFAAATPVFAMGSCFAREIEHALSARGGNVISIDDRIERPEFEDAGGKVRTTFFHRYTPTAMAQEFRWPFGRQDGWSEDALIFAAAAGNDVDLNYAAVAADNTPEAVALRRGVAGALVRKLVDARIIIVTLGLTEGWVHLPTGLAVNAMSPRMLKARPEEFALSQIDYPTVIASLQGILDLIEAEHADGDFQLFVTVSPVPFQSTFSREDIVEANLTSKSTLRAAAVAFVREHERVHYFPSYELVTYTSPDLAWRPDRVHVNPGMVKHIMNRFIDTVYEPAAFG
ncbi:GSCFA domain-containing protein [Sphingomonas solaris]|uniref:GSCFA domain-containing protein n=1 Tax=Alterirhizorhabdus solaris TaxID=2529389 RepID=A0A558QU74_9SPHN|nr:GSCFA domain-containing protein [Sphingomonas solaris]TVV70669.1 GSCFA domain-containing protein [Sphingomonas solaris]